MKDFKIYYLDDTREDTQRSCIVNHSILLKFLVGF